MLPEDVFHVTFLLQVSKTDSMGACRVSCGACEPCKSKENGCYHRNRQKDGYLELNEKTIAEM